jgi:hypothetical protein
MKNLKFNMNNLDLIKIIFTLILILVFTLPIVFFGITDLEDYNYGFFSSYIIGINHLNPFIFFSDSIGPGINFPMGNGVFFNPLLLFIKNTQLFYFLITVLHLSLQSFYFVKINKLLDIKKYVIFFIPLIIFSNTNFNSHYSDDWITASSNFTFVFIIAYYFLKILKKNLLKDYIKFSIFFFLFFENGHIGFIFFNCIFLIILFIFSKNKIRIIKNNKLYIFLVILIFLLLEKFYYFGNIFLGINSYKEVADAGFIANNPGVNDFIKSLFPTSYYKSINRLPSNPFLIILSFLFILFFKKKENFINLKYIFFIIIIFNFSEVLEFLSFIMSASWWIRDFTLIVSCLICLQYFDQLKKYLKIFLITLLLSYSIFYFVKNFSGIMKNTNNFIVNQPNNLTMINFFDNLKIDKNFNRVYLSPNAHKLLDKNNSAKFGIYNAKDLIKFNLSPFNVRLKNNISTIFFKQPINTNYYYSGVMTQIEDMKNLFFLSIFNINYSFLSEDELNLLDINNFEIIDILSLNGEEFYFIKNKINLLGIKNPKELEKNINKCKNSILECLNLEKNLFYKMDGNFIKEKNSNYRINVKSNFDLFPVIPFVFDKNWKCNKIDCFQIGEFLTYSNNNNNETIEIKYHDKVRFVLRLLSLLIFISLLALLIFKKNNNKFN